MAECYDKKESHYTIPRVAHGMGKEKTDHVHTNGIFISLKRNFFQP